MRRLLEASDIHVRYGSAEVLRGVSFEADAGEVVGLVGPNGAGKSTLLRVAAGLQSAAAGSVQLDGRDLDSMTRRDRARTLGFVPQDTRIDFPLSVEQVVLLGRHPHGRRLSVDSARDFAAAESAMARVGILGYRDRRYSTLSGGERQLVMLASALAGEPRLLLLDEPVSALDLRHQLLALQVVREFAAGGGGCVVILHDLNLAARYCDRILLLEQGQLRASGAPPEVLRPLPLRSAYRVGVAVRSDDVLACPSVVAVAPREGGPAAISGSGPELVGALAALFRRGCVHARVIVPPGSPEAAAAEALGFETVAPGEIAAGPGARAWAFGPPPPGLTRLLEVERVDVERLDDLIERLHGAMDGTGAATRAEPGAGDESPALAGSTSTGG